MVMVDWLSSWTRLYDGKGFTDGCVPLAGMGGLVATELCERLRQGRTGKPAAPKERPPFLQMAAFRDGLSANLASFWTRTGAG